MVSYKDTDCDKVDSEEQPNFKFPTHTKEDVTSCNSADIYVTLDESGSYTERGFSATIRFLKSMVAQTLDGDSIRWTFCRVRSHKMNA